MSKLNAKGKNTMRKFSSVPTGLSYNGNPQYVKADAQQLYELAVNTLYGKDAYYETSDEMVKRAKTLVESLVKDGQLDFIANTIVHARTDMKIRTMPIALTVFFAKALRDNQISYPHLRTLTKDVIQRADQLTDLYALALETFGDKKLIPMAIKRGVADAFNKFTEYQFAKYDRPAGVKIKDVLRIVHPVAFDGLQGEVFSKIVSESLATPYTWEVELSKNGQLPAGEQKSKKQLWTELATSGKMGYMALLRNLRNIVEADVTAETIKTVADTLSNADNVKKSKQFPFSFVKALKALDENAVARSSGYSYYHRATPRVANVSKSNTLTEAISTAIDHSLGNLPQLGKNVWVIVDCSGSMSGEPFDTACLFGAALAKSSTACENFTMTLFSDNAKHVTGLRRSDSVLTNYERLLKLNQGGGTNLEAALRLKSTLGFEPDTVIVLSDMQINQLSNRSYDPMKLFGKDVMKVAINLAAGYGTTPCHEVGGWYQLSGWSESLFDWIPAMREKVSVVKALSVPYKALPSKNAFRDRSAVEDVEAA